MSRTSRLSRTSRASINLKNVEMKNIIQKLAEWTGKVIIPNDEVMGQKITIYSGKEVPRSQALVLIYSALRAKGFVAEQTDSTIYLKPIKEAKLLSVPIIPPDVPLAAIENKEQIVQKFFKLSNYSPTSMSEIVSNLIGEYGYVSADESTGKLLIIDTVKSLIRIEGIIAQFDVPEAGQTVTRIFKIQQGDPAEIVQVLRILLGEEGGRSIRGSRPSLRSRRDRERNSRISKPRDRGKSGGAATSVVIGSGGVPIVLIPEPRRKWIIARASPDDIKLIEDWIGKLDKKERVEPEYETVQIKYADVEEVARRLNEVVQEMPGTELKTSVLIQPLVQARQIVIYGRVDIRQMVKKLITQIDIPSGQFETKVFKLEHADPEQIKKNIEDLYADENADLPWWYRRRRGKTSDWVKVIAFPTMQQVTVIAAPENMRKIEKQVAKWDVPINVDKVKPRIITLYSTDPVKMAELMTKLFSEETESWRPWWMPEQPKKKIVGPLYGQLTFEAVPGTRKIIVISKIPEAYKVVEKFVKELDKQEMTEVPKVVTIEYADPEDLSERLNAMFCEPGTVATIRLSEQGLSKTGMEETESKTGDNSTTKTETAQGEYKPWWTGGRPKPDEMPISKVIGRIRFVPDPRSKAILVLAPKEFMESIEKVIKELDKPGKQVRVKAIVIEIDHSDTTSLGLQLAKDTATFGTLDADSLVALTKLGDLDTHGTWTLTPVNINALVDFLVKKMHAKILNQQTLWTKDNKEAVFFKGQKIAFTTSTAFSAEGSKISSSFDYQSVGMTLRVRPSITPQKNVDMNIDLAISQLTGEDVSGQPVRTYTNTTTTAIVQNNQTIMLGGILFQKESAVQRKIALLGDIPLAGGLFRHNETVESNNELIIFITPEVINTSDMLSETKKASDKLKEMKGKLRGSAKNREDNKEVEGEK